MVIGYQSEVGRLRKLVVKHARDAFVSDAKIDAEWKPLNYFGRPDLAAAVAEYDRFVEALQALDPDVEIAFLPKGPGLTMDALYPRDAAIACNKGMILCNMGKPARRAEPAAERALFQEHGVPVYGAITGEGHVEGGDVAWIDEKTLAVGRGYRTNDEGIRQLRALIEPCGAELVVVPSPHYHGPSDVFHLMSVLSPIDHDLALVYSPLMVVPFRELLLERGIRLVEVPDEEFESMGCNVLAVAPSKCLMLDGNPETRRRLEKAGAEVRVYDGTEISRKGAGGPTCMTRPILRELRTAPAVLTLPAAA
ncbi:MAG TPA: arginine deiminase family protein [Hypericibacter adhaerens]|uniref:dimethylarginine dimethylaminohydrolase family protein n=1 Tax=Hypericibacter adhaerens TaxID=2602016 RepID=UPI002BCCCB95|nr:arginine deiminase family protein [Hypericibacter adhaerens]HWA45748.1 arginine deiminase family protein [Hypericibacter adhaerens]